MFNETSSSDLLYDVFLSYSRDDAEIMRQINTYLTAERLIVWSDETHILPGDPSWERTIQLAIEQSCCLVVIFSPSAKNSLWVDRETGYARIMHKPVFPVLAAGGEQNAIPLAFANAQWLDIRGNGVFSNRMQTLLAAIQQNPEIKKRSNQQVALEKDIAHLGTKTAHEPQSGLQQYTFRGPASEEKALSEATDFLNQLLRSIPKERFILANLENKLLIRSLIAYEKDDGPLVYSKDILLNQAFSHIKKLGDNAFQNVLTSSSASESYPELQRDEIITITVEFSEQRMSPQVIIEIISNFKWGSAPE